jgi:hypothetical protein
MDGVENKSLDEWEDEEEIVPPFPPPPTPPKSTVHTTIQIIQDSLMEQ